MSRRVLLHAGILSALFLFSFYSWNEYKAERLAFEEAKYDRPADYDPNMDDLQSLASLDETTAMLKVGIPLIGGIIYLGTLFVSFLLPATADRLATEMMGSTAGFADDPLDQGRAAAAEGDFAEAIRLFRQAAQDRPYARFPLTEIARLQRTELNSVRLAIDTLEEALTTQDWSNEDQAFLLFQIAEIYEEDLNDPAEAVAVMKRIELDLKETEHAGKAAEKRRKLEGEAL